MLIYVYYLFFCPAGCINTKMQVHAVRNVVSKTNIKYAIKTKLLLINFQFNL